MTTAFTDIDTATIEEHEALLTQLLAEAYPTYNLTRGSVLNKILLRPAAVLSAELSGQISQLRAGMSVSALRQVEDPESIPAATIDAVLANYQASRRPGSAATGTLVVVLSRNVSAFIGDNYVFTSAGGVAFSPTGPFAAVTNSELKTSNKERVITQLGDGRFAFTVPVTAKEQGAAGSVAARTAFEVSPAIPYAETIYAESDFSGGADPETNEEVLFRLDEAITPEAPASRISYRKFIKAQFPSVTDVSIIGAGDVEMTRDRNNIFGMSTYGKVDVFPRTAAVPSLAKLTRAAQLRDDGTLAIFLGSGLDDLPGFYRVEHILPAGTNAGDDTAWEGSLEILQVIREVNPDAVPGVRPYIGSAAEAVYSAYQTAHIVFSDPAAAAGAGSSDNGGYSDNGGELLYDIYVRYMPQIHEIQAYVGGADIKDPGCDVLVRAPVPCFVSAELNILYRDGYLDPYSETLSASIRTAVAAAVNGVLFSNPKLSVSLIVNAVHEVIGDAGYVDLPLFLRARILAPDGAEIVVRDSEAVNVPTDVPRGLGRRVTAYYMLPESVGITYEAM